MFRKRNVGPAVLVFLLAPVITYAWDGDRNETACEKTAEIMVKACRYDVRDDYLTTVANCTNISDWAERRDCYDDAGAVRREEAEYCADVEEARKEACEILGENRYDPDPLLAPGTIFIDPDDVGTADANPYVSIVEGHTYVLKAGEDGEEIVVVHVTGDTREILGVDCRVVVDVVVEKAEEEGETEYEAVEVTDDWFAQDTLGNVYYCGEVARNFEDGVLRDLDGSFEAGIEFAKSGILMMNAFPGTGIAHRQEYALGEAEDIIQYLDDDAIPTEEEGGDNELFPCAPLGCVLTFDFAPIEPESTEFKYYVPGTGFVLAVGMEDGEFTGEREELVCIGDSLDVLTDDPNCGIADPKALLETLCTLSPDVFCED